MTEYAVLSPAEAAEADDATLAVIMGEAVTAYRHGVKTRAPAEESVRLMNTVVNCAIEWARRHDLAGAPTGVIVAAARRWAADNPDAVAEYDRRFETFMGVAR